MDKRNLPCLLNVAGSCFGARPKFIIPVPSREY